MSVLPLLFLLIFLSFCVSQRPQCPRRGQVRRPDPNNNRRFLQCNDGRGRWFICSEGFEYADQRQDCVAQSRSTSTRSSTRGSPSQSSTQGNSRRQMNSNTNNGGSSGGSNGWVEFDYHW